MKQETREWEWKSLIPEMGKMQFVLTPAVCKAVKYYEINWEMSSELERAIAAVDKWDKLLEKATPGSTEFNAYDK